MWFNLKDLHPQEKEQNSWLWNERTRSSLYIRIPLSLPSYIIVVKGKKQENSSYPLYFYKELHKVKHYTHRITHANI